MINIPFNLENKNILITGASSGIGKATAILCSQMGAKLIITGRDEIKLNRVFIELYGSGHKKIVSDFDEDGAIELLVSLLEKLDGIVHSAGISENLPFSYTNREKLSKIMKINFEAPFILTQLLVRKKLIQKEASIVFVSSISGFSTVARGGAAYSASKGAISASIRVMALELATKKIRVNAVCPGMVKTDMNFKNDNIIENQLIDDEIKNYPLGYGSPEQIASSICFLLCEGSSWITGTNLIIDGGASIQ
ncbi:MAG: SDR family NAD(P)-dependent oxidoreductase [Bacteroidota bacterium]